VRAEVENAEGRLVPGQFVRVRVELPAEDDVIAVPQTALVTSLYGDYVYRLRPLESAGDAAPGADQAGQEGAQAAEAQNEAGNGEVFVAEQIFVKVGRRANGSVEIVEGLSAGDVVVDAGQNRLSNGARVTIDNTVRPIQMGAEAR